jgi:hypothetical protein
MQMQRLGDREWDAVPLVHLNAVSRSGGAVASEPDGNPRSETGSIGWAVSTMRSGNAVSRAGWNGKGMYLSIVPAVGARLPYVQMRTAQGDFVPWLCSQTDLLATDWHLAG